MNDKKAGKADLGEEKISVCVYLSPEVLERIDDCLFYLKKRLPMEKRRKLTKSVFFELGLGIAAEEYNATGENSALWKAVYNFLSD